MIEMSTQKKLRFFSKELRHKNVILKCFEYAPYQI